MKKSEVKIGMKVWYDFLSPKEVTVINKDHINDPHYRGCFIGKTTLRNGKEIIVAPKYKEVRKTLQELNNMYK